MNTPTPIERAVQLGGPPLSIAIGVITTAIANALNLGPGAGQQITHIEHVLAGHMQTATSIAAPGDPVAQAIFSVGVFIISTLVPHLTHLKFLDGIKSAQPSGITAPDGTPDPAGNASPGSGPSAGNEPGPLPSAAEELASAPTHIAAPEPRPLRNDPGTATPVQQNPPAPGPGSEQPAPDTSAPAGDQGVGQ